MDMLDSLVKAPIIGLYIAFIPLLWCFAVHALNHACIADVWLYNDVFTIQVFYKYLGMESWCFYEKYDCYC